MGDDGLHPRSGEEQTHRGAFGDYGGEERGLIDRTFRERIILVGVIRDEGSEEETDEALDELEQLVDTAGADVVERVTQKRHSPDPGTFIGTGKAKEIYELAEALDVDTVVFDDELTPAQQSNLAGIFKRSALDRTAVILDIFAQNATTPRGQGPGRAGAAALPLASAAGLGQPAEPTRRWHWHPRSG